MAEGLTSELLTHTHTQTANALREWQRIEEAIQGKQLVLFLDYDGTLSPIVPEPESAFMKASMRPVLERVAASYTTAIVTGRSKDKIYNFVQLDDIFYASSHGLEIKGPISCPVRYQMGDLFRPDLTAALASLEELKTQFPGVELEDNTLAISVHYRNCSAELVEDIYAVVRQYADNSPRLILTHGRKVFELRPRVDWNKGSAVLFILETLGLSNADNIVPVYLGDDLSDEDAFIAVKNFHQGIPVLVREDNDTERPDETHATFRLRNPDEVETFLRQLAGLKGSNKGSSSTVEHAEQSGEVMGLGSGFSHRPQSVKV